MNEPTLLEQFEAERDAVYRNKCNNIPKTFISKYNPRLSQRLDEERQQKIDRYMRSFAEVWWHRQGFKIIDLANGEFRAEEIGIL